MISSTHFQYITTKLTSLFVKEAKQVNPKQWQAIASPQPMRELLNISFRYQMPEPPEIDNEIKPNQPWASLHFEERVSGEPLNPGETYKQWPFYKMDSDMRRVDEKFSHTYMERFWPKAANWEEKFPELIGNTQPVIIRNMGIRYPYGDLKDVVMQLVDDPLTRQAYLPVFFPEDTGNTMNQRVPCTIGYQFILRENKLHIVYHIRSCDYIRHFRDDVYLACRLAYWVLVELRNNKANGKYWEDVTLGTLTMHITSLHVFESDMYRINKEHEKNNQR